MYEPRKDEAYPLGFLSRHPLPETEKIIREETQKDEVIQRSAKRIAKGEWEKHKKDKDLEPYLHVQQELSVAEGLIFREPFESYYHQHFRGKWLN